MFCAITTGMMLYTGSVANLPCSDFNKVEPPEQKEVRLEVDVPKPIKTTTPDLRTTAIYDISARQVILPSGEKLEAHSGLGPRKDDPQAVKVKAKGPTPPNHYKLTLREKLFHGIRALRLNPVDEDKMHGRDGILAHPYMLGKGGDSWGCVSFRDYPRFLKEYLAGRVTDMLVVRKADEVKQYASKE